MPSSCPGCLKNALPVDIARRNRQKCVLKSRCLIAVTKQQHGTDGGKNALLLNSAFLVGYFKQDSSKIEVPESERISRNAMMCSGSRVIICLRYNYVNSGLERQSQLINP